MDRDDLFEQDRGENYDSVKVGQEINLPMTRPGFERLLTVLSERFGVPADDGCRQVLAGYVHHIPNEADTADFNTLGRVLRKSIANGLTWKIDQEIKEKRRAEEAKKKEESTPQLVDSSAQASAGA